MRVAVISRVFSKSAGGAESYSVAIAEQLAKQHEIHVFAQESNHPVVGLTYHRVFCLARKPRWVNQLLFALASWWQTRTGFDVVHSHENTWHGQIQTIHVRPVRHNLFHGRTGVRRLLRWLKVALSPRLLAYVFLEAARFKPAAGRSVVAASETLKDECVQAYPDCLPFLSVITPGAHLPVQTVTRAEARLALGLPAEAPLLLFVANDYARKGLDALLKATTQLRADVQLVVAGNPAHIPRYRQKAEALGLQGRVHFLGSVNDLSPAYRAADCLAHPTLEDSFAMVVLEAMAHGLPVVVSGPAHCGISEHLQDGVQALLLHDPRDAGELARRIVQVLQDGALAEGLRRQALTFAQQHSWEEAALQYEALYR
jgi:UDP-glucose:(heptosyl)LPS alpha-1,3-glucosyltransferase